MKRRRTIGAEPVSGGVHFRVWAPARQRVAVVIDGRDHPLEREASGHFSGLVASARAGTRYRFRLDDEEETYPDPASRYQPEGPHGAERSSVGAGFQPARAPIQHRSEQPDHLRDPHRHVHARRDVRRRDREAAAPRRRSASTSSRSCRSHEFPGRFGWGYDGVDLFAPAHLYGTPDDFRALRRRRARPRHSASSSTSSTTTSAPTAATCTQFTADYFTTRYRERLGRGDQLRERARRARILRRERRVLDRRVPPRRPAPRRHAVHPRRLARAHPRRDRARRARAAAGDRTIFIVAENEAQDRTLIDGVRPRRALERRLAPLRASSRSPAMREAYYSDYRGKPQEFVSMAKYGFLFQGQWYSWQKQAPRHTVARHRAAPPRALPAESRSGRELGARRAHCTS